MLRKILSIVCTGVMCLVTSCTAAKTEAPKKAASTPDAETIRQLRSLGYVDEITDEKQTIKELESLGYINTKTSDQEKVKKELRSLGYIE